MNTRLRAILLVLAVVLGASPGAAQESAGVVVDPDLPESTRRLIHRALEQDGVRVRILERTVVAEGQEVAGSLVQVGGELVIAGRVSGDVTGIGARVFVRPGARVDGRITVLDGAYYGTKMAELEVAPVWLRAVRLEVVEGPPDAARVEARGVRVRAPSRGLGFPFEPKGFGGIALHHYNGVDGLSFGLVAGLKRLPRQPRTELAGGPVFRTVRSDVGFQVTGLREFRGTGGLTVGASGYRVTASPQDWHRTGYSNTLASLFLADDDKTWYEREGYTVWVERPFLADSVTVRLEWRDDDFETLESETPFAFFADDEEWRVNPEIEDGEGRNLGLEATWDRRDVPGLPRRGWWAKARYDHWGFDGDFDFDFLQADARAYLPVPVGDGSFASFRAVGGGRLGDADTLAPQFWYRLGGGSTLPGYNSLEPILTGDRMAFATVTYHHGIPVTSRFADRFYLVLLGTVGDAWFEGDDFDANTGAGFGLAIDKGGRYAGAFGAYGVEVEEWEFYIRLKPWF